MNDGNPEYHPDHPSFSKLMPNFNFVPALRFEEITGTGYELHNSSSNMLLLQLL
jgi:hypothetical protein